MKTEFVSVIQDANVLVTDIINRSRILGAAVALAVSRQLPLPTGPVEVPAGHYNQLVAQQARTTISMLNEDIVFDCLDSIERVRQFWMLRYVAAHGSANTLVKADAGFIDALVGANQVIDADYLTFLNEHKVAVLAMAGRISTALNAIAAANGGAGA